MTHQDALYEDGYLTITKETLTIHWYWFPYGSRTFKIGEIEKVGHLGDFGIEEWYQIKTWGMALSNVWWALDSSRLPGIRTKPYPNQLIVKLKGHDQKAGFGVKDDTKVLQLLSELM